MNIESISGETVFNGAKRAISEAYSTGTDITFTHNDTTVNVYPESYLHDILEKYDLMRRMLHLSK